MWLPPSGGRWRSSEFRAEASARGPRKACLYEFPNTNGGRENRDLRARCRRSRTVHRLPAKAGSHMSAVREIAITNHESRITNDECCGRLSGAFCTVWCLNNSRLRRMISSEPAAGCRVGSARGCEDGRGVRAEPVRAIEHRGRGAVVLDQAAAAVNSPTRSWTDVDGDRLPARLRSSISGTGGCRRISMSTTCSTERAAQLQQHLQRHLASADADSRRAPDEVQPSVISGLALPNRAEDAEGAETISRRAAEGRRSQRRRWLSTGRRRRPCGERARAEQSPDCVLRALFGASVFPACRPASGPTVDSHRVFHGLSAFLCEPPRLCASA